MAETQKKTQKKPATTKKAEIYYPATQCDNFSDGLRRLGLDATFNGRKAIADANGIENYISLGMQNRELRLLLNEGKLKKLK